MVALGALLALGLVMTSWWSAAAYRSWPANDLAVPTRHKGSAARLAGLAYLRTATVAVVGGIWAGALFTGPAVRLIMRLLAATAGNDAQGKLTALTFALLSRLRIAQSVSRSSELVRWGWIAGGGLRGLRQPRSVVFAYSAATAGSACAKATLHQTYCTRSDRTALPGVRCGPCRPAIGSSSTCVRMKPVQRFVSCGPVINPPMRGGWASFAST